MGVRQRAFSIAILIGAVCTQTIAAQAPSPASVNFSAGPYLFPGLLDVLYTSEIRRIPDGAEIRAYYMGVFKSFSVRCGEPTSAYVSETMLAYGFPRFREARRNPAAALEGALQDVVGLASGQTIQGGGVALEGIEDADIFVQRHGCQTPVFQRMRQNLGDLGKTRYQSGPTAVNLERLIAMMSPAYRKKRGISDPPAPRAEWWSSYLGTWTGTAR